MPPGMTNFPVASITLVPDGACRMSVNSATQRSTQAAAEAWVRMSGLHAQLQLRAALHAAAGTHLEVGCHLLDELARYQHIRLELLVVVDHSAALCVCTHKRR